MDTHKNARLTFAHRLEMVQEITESGSSVPPRVLWRLQLLREMVWTPPPAAYGGVQLGAMGVVIGNASRRNPYGTLDA